MTDSWEERMAARARARREAQTAEDKLTRVLEAAVERIRGDDWSWLNGWPRMGITGVLVGTGVHCIGCGALQGVTTVAIEEGWEPPPTPLWPYEGERRCPICLKARP